MTEPSCSTCHWWLTIPAEGPIRTPMQAAVASTMDLIDCDDWLGACRRYPPVIAGQPVSDDTGVGDMALVARRSAWPITWAGMGCGEHRTSGHAARVEPVAQPFSDREPT